MMKQVMMTMITDIMIQDMIMMIWGHE